MKNVTKYRKTNEEFTNEIYKLVGNEYTFLEEYKGSNTKILVKHNVCGHEYKVSPSNFKGNNSKKGTRCPKCQKVHRRTPEEFVIDILNLVNNEYLVLSDFKNATTKVMFKHVKCEHEFEMTPNNFLRGQRCSKCYGIHRRTTEEFKRDVLEIHGEEYIVLGEFVRTSVKIKMKHVICGYEYEATPNNILKGHRCAKCACVKRKTTEEFKVDVFNLVGEGYEVLSEYTIDREPITLKHVECGHIFSTTPDAFLQGKCRCHKCNSSKGEKFISDYLHRLNIEHKLNFRFSDCKYDKPLPFDVTIFKEENIVLIIEYDGQHHFKPVTFGGISMERAYLNLQNTQRNDQIKNNYCEDNNIPLLRIPYWDFDNIDSILLNNTIISKLISKEIINT